MAVSLYTAGLAHARSLIASGHVDQSSDWSFSAEDGNKLLGDPPNWTAYAKWFLGHDASADKETKAAWEYPFGKDGKLYRSALRAIASRGAQNDASDVSSAASGLLKELDKAARPAVKRAYATLTIKSVDDEQRVIEGIASTPSTDRMGDIVEPQGAQFSLPMPLLWQHDSTQPIGQVTDAKVTPAGIQIRAQIAKGVLPQIDQAWALVKSGLVRGLSIGFSPVETADIQGTWGTRFLKWAWYELSCVTIPANQDANIQTVKSCDTTRAASRPVKVSFSTTRPGVSGVSRRESAMKIPIADQIEGFKTKRATNVARMEEIQAKAAEDGRSKNEAEREEFDTLANELQSIDKEIEDLKQLEALAVSKATRVTGGNPDDGSQSRGLRIVVPEKKLPPGIGFTRLAMCIAKAKGSQSDALMFAKNFYPEDSALHAAVQIAPHVKTAVGAATAGSGNWAADLVPYNILQDDFITYLRAGNIVDKFGTTQAGADIPPLRVVPFNVRVSGFSAGTSGNWVGEGKPVPLSKATSFNQQLTWAKAEGIAVLTNEEVRFSNPSAEAKVRDDLAAAVNTRIDIDFVDPANVGSAGIKPASITNNIAATAPSGAAASNLITDLGSLFKLFAQNLLDLNGVVLVMSAQMATEISLMTTSLGFQYFPTMTVQGGMLRGVPVLVSENLTSVGSPGTQTIIAVKASEVYKADDGAVTVDASNQASLEMSDGPSQDGTAGTGASLVSLWQSGLLGIKIGREINWSLRRSTAVQYIAPAAYSA